MEGRDRYFFWVVVSVAAALIFLGLGEPSLIDPDEARFARTSVEMTRSRDLVVPTFEGKPRIVKPPLLHWMQAALFLGFGSGELPSRLPAAFATLGSMFLVAWIARRRFGMEGAAWAAAIFITQPLVFITGRLGTTDALLSFHVLGALSLDMAEPDEAGRHKAAAMGALLGMAFLAKGPIGIVLPLLVILAGRTATGREVLPRSRTLLVALAGWGVVVLPWGLAFLKRLGAGEVFGSLRRETLERYFSESIHMEPPWYYATVLILGCLPWVATLPLALFRVAGRLRSRTAPTALYAGAGLLAGLLFFSLGKGKLPQYILPLSPLVALVVAWELGRELEAPGPRRLGPSLLAGALLLLMVILGAVAAVHPDAAVRYTGLVGAISYGAGGLVALAGLLRHRPRLVYGAAAVAGAAFLMAGALVLHPAIGRDRSAAPLLEKVPELASGRPVLLIDIDIPSMTFYRDRVSERVPLEELISRLRRPDDPLLVVASADLGRVRPDVLTRLREIGRHGKLHVFEKIHPHGETMTKPDGPFLDSRRDTLLR